MKLKKKLMSVFLAFALAVGTVPAMPMGLAGTGTVVSAYETTSDGFEYQLINDDKEILITGYNGSAEDVTVPAKINGKPVTSVASYTFYYDHNIKTIKFSNGITKLNDNCIYYCSGLTSISIPASVEIIDTCPIYRCNSLTTIKVSSSNQFFTASKNCLYSKDKTVLYSVPSGLESFTVPSTVKKISDKAFSYSGIKTIKLNSGLESIGSYAFSNTDITSVTLPSSLTELGSYAFSNCSSLTSVKFNSGLRTIGYRCFYYCTELGSVSLPDTIESVEGYAFYNCPKIKTITIPSSVTSIGNYAFGYYSDGSISARLPDITLKCSYSSAGMNYAVNNDMKYIIVDPQTAADMLQSFNSGTPVELDIPVTDHYWSSANNGIYYFINSTNGPVLMLRSFEDGKVTKVREFTPGSCDIDLVSKLRSNTKADSTVSISEYSIPSNFSSYCQGSKLYIGCKYQYRVYQDKYIYYYVYVLYVYDMDSKTLLNTYYIGDSLSSTPGSTSYSAVGADSKGRVFLARSLIQKEKVTDPDTGETTEKKVTKYYVDMYSSSMKLITSAESLSEVFYFGDFDASSGIFSMCVYYNWIYYGYDHDMHAVVLGKAGKKTLEIQNTLLTTIGQMHYSSIDRPIRNIGKYICIDSPLKVAGSLIVPYISGLFVYDLNGLYDESMMSSKLDLKRDYYLRYGHIYHDGSRYARVCAVPGGSSDHIIAVEGSRTIVEYDPEAGEKGRIGQINTDQPVYELFSDNEYLYVIMIDSEDPDKFYIQKMLWSSPTKVTLSKSKLSLKVADRKQLTASTDGTLAQTFKWSTSDPTVVSVSSSGVLTAMKAGKAVITVMSSNGLKASCTVTVTDSDLAELTGQGISTIKSQISDNDGDNYYYGTWSKPVRSYIHENSDKTITRAEFYNNTVYIENYEADGKSPISKTTIKPELPLFGGIFMGKSYNFIVFGQQNSEQSDETEVVRVVKYSKTWEKLGSASIKGANTYIPFDAGSLRMDESGGKLYIHTCHEMYAGSDNVHHQANMTYTVNEKSMKVEQQQYEIFNYTTGYISHSFNQFVKVDGNRVYRLDHGDANPRGIFINYFLAGSDPTEISGKTIVSFGSSNYSYNYTGANIGGFEVMSHNAVAAYSSLDQSDLSNSRQYNIYIVTQDKDFTDSSEIIKITDHSEDSNITVGTPQLVKINKDILLLMWQETSGKKSVTKFVTVNEDGTLTSEITTLNTAISDCQPVYCSDGLVRWYVTKGSEPVFYAVNPFYLSEYGKHIIGDVNADGSIDMKDITDLQRYINGWDVEISEKNADYDCNGEINMKDIAALQRLINS